MKCHGKLYGKFGEEYVPLIMTSEDVDRIEQERNDFLEALIAISNNPHLDLGDLVYQDGTGTP
jgi:hypothetical protein